MMVVLDPPVTVWKLSVAFQVPRGPVVVKVMMAVSSGVAMVVVAVVVVGRMMVEMDSVVMDVVVSLTMATTPPQAPHVLRGLARLTRMMTTPLALAVAVVAVAVVDSAVMAMMDSAVTVVCAGLLHLMVQVVSALAQSLKIFLRFLRAPCSWTSTRVRS